MRVETEDIPEQFPGLEAFQFHNEAVLSTLVGKLAKQDVVGTHAFWQDVLPGITPRIPRQIPEVNGVVLARTPSNEHILVPDADISEEDRSELNAHEQLWLNAYVLVNYVTRGSGLKRDRFTILDMMSRGTGDTLGSRLIESDNGTLALSVDDYLDSIMVGAMTMGTLADVIEVYTNFTRAEQDVINFEEYMREEARRIATEAQVPEQIVRLAVQSLDHVRKIHSLGPRFANRLRRVSKSGGESDLPVKGLFALDSDYHIEDFSVQAQPPVKKSPQSVPVPSAGTPQSVQRLDYHLNIATEKGPAETKSNRQKTRGIANLPDRIRQDLVRNAQTIVSTMDADSPADPYLFSLAHRVLAVWNVEDISENEYAEPVIQHLGDEDLTDLIGSIPDVAFDFLHLIYQSQNNSADEKN